MNMVRIEGLRVRAVRVPMPHPHRTAGGVVEESPLVLTDVLTDAGVVGHGMVFTYTAAALEPTAAMVRNLEPLLKGQPAAPVEIEMLLSKKFRLLGTQGLVGMAMAAVDMALWDARARLHGVSLVELLGGTIKPVPAYGAVGYDGPEGSARVAADWAARGFKGVKAKIGYATVEEDLAVIRAIRKAVGEGVAILVDYNQSLSPAEAVERLHRLEGEGLAWVEEPTRSHDHAGHALIARSSPIPIQNGENWWGTLDLAHALDAGACDHVMLDVMKVGGVTGWLRGAAMAQAKGARVSSHLWPELSAQLLCVTPTAHWLEFGDWWHPVVAEPLQVKDGLAVIPDAPGAGVTWNEEAVARFAVE
ncbi:MAG: enolase C-terminal domain-like protein [Isosphaeraceae bacterium]